MQICDDKQFVRDPLDHHVCRLNQPRHSQPLTSLKGKSTVVLYVMRVEARIGDKSRVETMDNCTECQPIPPARTEVRHLKVEK